MGHTGAMIALFPDTAYLGRMAIAASCLPNAQPIEDLHITVCYLGTAADLDKAAVLSAVQQVANKPPVSMPLALRVRGLDRFPTREDDGTNALYARIICPELHTLRDSLIAALDMVGVKVRSDFGSYTPHMTLGYAPEYLPTPAVRVPLVTIPAAYLYLCWADDEPIVIPMMQQATTKEVSGPMATPAHGPGGLFSNPALGGALVKRRSKSAQRRLGLTTKPFASAAQQRFAFGTGQPWAKRRADETDFSSLPAKVKASAGETGSGSAAGGGKGYGARAGETIRGNLTRGGNGQFASAGGGSGFMKSPPKAPKKPKGGKGAGGGKPKKPALSAEQRQAEREARRAEALAKNLDAVGEAFLDNDSLLSKSGLADLASFGDGKSLSDDKIASLSKLGVIEVGADGQPRMTKDGKAILSAAKRGDVRGALDAASRAGERVGIGPAGEAIEKPAKDDKPQSLQDRLRKVKPKKGDAAVIGEGGKPSPDMFGTAEDPSEEKPKGGGGGGGGKGDEPADPKDLARIASAGAGGAKPSNPGGQTTSAPMPKPLRAGPNREAAIAQTAERVGLGRDGLRALRGAAGGSTVDPKYGAALVRAGLAERRGDTYEATDQGRQALSAVERGNMRNWQSAIQNAQNRLQREAAAALREASRKKTVRLLELELELLRLKHGRHNQASHGKKGRAGQAGAAAYAAAREGGASHQAALGAQKEATTQTRAAIRAEAAQRRSERLASQAERARRAANSGQVTDSQRAALIDKANRLDARAGNAPPSGKGDETKAYGADPNQNYTLQHEVVDMADLKASNLANGAINPAYDPALQPRDRSRAASQAQIDQVARNLNSDVLVTDFHRIDSGSPILDAKGNVLSGNGRTLALQRAAEMHPAQYAAYKERLRAEAERLGIDPKAIDGMQNPVLVRKLKGDTDPVAFAREANSSGTLRMSPLEQAKVDAQTLRDQSVMRLNVREGQGIDQALRDPGNKPFINDFLSTVPDNERATLLTRNGELNQMGLYRAKAALYTKAFPGESGNRLAESMLESLDPEVKTIQNGISASLPNISRATSLIRSGDRDKDLDLSEDFAKTIDVYARIKDNPALTANTPANRLIDKYLGQSQMFERELTPDQEVILRHIDTISRKPTAVRDMFNSWADIVEKQPPPGQSSLFGDGPLTRRQLIDQIIGGQSAGTSQGGLFD